MKRPTQLEVVRGIAETKAQSLACEVGELMRENENARQMLERLQEYVADYTVSFPRAAGTATQSALSMQNQHRFVSKLNSALEQQRSRARHTDERAAQKVGAWQRARADLEAVERLIARRELVAVQDASRLEQLDSDAAALRAPRVGGFEVQDLG